MARVTSLVLVFAAALIGADRAAAQVPDFSGVYYPVAGGGGRGGGGGAAAQAGRGRGTPPPAPTRAAPTSDGSAGRAADAAKLTPQYMAKWEIIRKSRMSGSYEFDNSANCLPPGMPAMMAMAYGMEMMQSRDRITMVSELNDAVRR